MSTTPPSWVRATPSPSLRRLQPTGLTAEFLKNPFLFMRTHSMSPPSNSGFTWAGDLGTVANTQHASGVNFDKSSEHQKLGTNIERRTGSGGMRYAQIVNHPAPNFPGATSLKIAPGNGFVNDGTWMPIYFLPWASLKILAFDIPLVPQSIVDPDDEEYPRFFFTAGINGCSVFAHGHPHGPTLSHAGLDDKLSRSAGEFWRTMMAKTSSGYGSSAISGEINTHDYMFKGGKAKQLADKYLKFLQGDSEEFKMEVTSPYGCVFGIRYGRSWTIYLQRSVAFNKIRFFKRSDVRSEENQNRKDYFVKGNNQQATKEKSTFVPRKLGPITLPMKKEVKVFSTSNRFSMPLTITEMFPNRKEIGELTDIYKIIV